MRNPMDGSKNINVRLFRKIQQMILKHPEAFDMGSYRGRTPEEKKEGAEGLTRMTFDPKTMKKPDCGSACCIAGWAVTLGDKRPLAEIPEDGLVWKRAEELLGLTSDQGTMLFTWKCFVDPSAAEAADMIDRFLENPATPKLI